MSVTSHYLRFHKKFTTFWGVEKKLKLLQKLSILRERICNEILEWACVFDNFDCLFKYLSIFTKSLYSLFDFDMYAKWPCYGCMWKITFGLHAQIIKKGSATFATWSKKKLSVYCALYDMIVIYQKLSFEIADKPSHALKNGETFLTNSTHRRRKTLSKNLVKREKGTYNKRNGDCNRKLLARLSKVCIEMELFEKMDWANFLNIWVDWTKN